ncbi:MAG TPA: thioredoxin domain-containing protein [Candidatus Acidoferrales bacterium]|nr:thioredoxin domain-containing protein [Candidatus Acidoferrales bacterium]
MASKVKSAFICSLVLACVPLMAQVTPASLNPNGDVVAEVNGHALTAADLEHSKSGSLLQARYTYYQTERKALDELVDEKLLALAAAEKNETVDQMLANDVYKGITGPTEDQMQVYYEGMESDEPYSAMRTRLYDHILDMRKSKARAAFVKTLREKANLHITLQPPTSDVNTTGAPIDGSKNAPLQLVEFADYECPYCQKVNPSMHQLKKEYGDRLTIVYKEFPLPMHKHAQKSAEAALCAGEQGKYLEFHDMLFNTRALEVADLKKYAVQAGMDGNAFNQCLDSGKEAAAVAKDLDEGKALGLTGTPSFFLNGHYFHGGMEYSALKEMVDQEIYAMQASPSTAQRASTK